MLPYENCGMALDWAPFMAQGSYLREYAAANFSLINQEDEAAGTVCDWICIDGISRTSPGGAAAHSLWQIVLTEKDAGVLPQNKPLLILSPP
jgi:hypothetical protein